MNTDTLLTRVTGAARGDDEMVPAMSAPGRQVDREFVVRSANSEPLAWAQAVKRPVDEQVTALVKPEVGQVDADQGR
jgi:hypothetical protein